jgi:hypothetical protein
MNGDMTYIGKPCFKKHSGERYVRGRRCVTCVALQAIEDQRRMQPAKPPRTKKPTVSNEEMLYWANNINPPKTLANPKPSDESFDYQVLDRCVSSLEAQIAQLRAELNRVRPTFPEP